MQWRHKAMDLPEAIGRGAGDPCTVRWQGVHAHDQTPKFRAVLISNSVMSFILTFSEPLLRRFHIAYRHNFTRFGTEDINAIKFLINHLIVTTKPSMNVYVSL